MNNQLNNNLIFKKLGDYIQLVDNRNKDLSVITLLGINIFIVYAIQGLLIFVALILDRIKEKIKDNLFHKETIKKFKNSQ